MGAMFPPRIWNQQPQVVVPINRDNTFGVRVIDAIYGVMPQTVAGKPVTKYGTLLSGAYPGGYGYKGAGAGGFGFPCDLTAYNAITIVFEYTQYSRAGAQVLFEHSANQNLNSGTFILYTDASSGLLSFGTSAGGVYDAGTCPLPPLGVKTTIALRLRFTSATGAADYGIAVNGVVQTTSSVAATVAAVNFGNYQTYILGRAGNTLNVDAVAGGYAVLAAYPSDSELSRLSANPWQIFQPSQSVSRLAMNISAMSNLISLGLANTPLGALAYVLGGGASVGAGIASGTAASPTLQGHVSTGSADVAASVNAALLSGIASLQAGTAGCTSQAITYILGLLGNAVQLGAASITSTARGITYNTAAGVIHVVPYEFLRDYDIVHLSGNVAVDRAGAVIIVLR